MLFGRVGERVRRRDSDGGPDGHSNHAVALYIAQRDVTGSGRLVLGHVALGDHRFRPGGNGVDLATNAGSSRSHRTDDLERHPRSLADRICNREGTVLIFKAGTSVHAGCESAAASLRATADLRNTDSPSTSGLTAQAELVPNRLECRHQRVSRQNREKTVNGAQVRARVETSSSHDSTREHPAGTEAWRTRIRGTGTETERGTMREQTTFEQTGVGWDQDGGGHGRGLLSAKQRYAVAYFSPGVQGGAGAGWNHQPDPESRSDVSTSTLCEGGEVSGSRRRGSERVRTDAGVYILTAIYFVPPRLRQRQRVPTAKCGAPRTRACT